MNVIIINDSPLLAAVIEAIVATNANLNIIGVARDGLEGVAMATQLLPDLVLMDIHMLKMNGVEASRRILAVLPKTLILITTATITRNMGHIFEALQHGVIDYVQSPSLPYAPGTRLSNDQLRKASAELLKKSIPCLM
ncbi:MAG: response regulator [Pseudomonadales bacterium]